MNLGRKTASVDRSIESILAQWWLWCPKWVMEVFTFSRPDRDWDVMHAINFANTQIPKLIQISHVFKLNEYIILFVYFDNVRTFWEAHKIWKKSSSWFWCLLSKCTKHEKDCTNFGALLRKSKNSLPGCLGIIVTCSFVVFLLWQKTNLALV